jgi:hypothetical protein
MKQRQSHQEYSRHAQMKSEIEKVHGFVIMVLPKATRAQMA